MKIKKIIMYFLFLLFVFPCFVYAEVCQKDDIKIVTIENIEEKGNVEESSSPTIDNNQINLGLKMNVIDDSVTYKVILKNTSNSDYVFDKNSLKIDYINYVITYEDESNIIKSGEEKVIFLRLDYNDKPQADNLSNGIFTKTSEISFNLVNEKGDSFINPGTGNRLLFSIAFIILLIGLSILIIKKYRKLSVLIVLLVGFITPCIVKASCNCTLDISLNLEIDAKDAVFLPGIEVNVKMKQLSGDDTSTVTSGYNYQNTSITSVKKSDIAPTDANKEDKNIVSVSSSEYPIYMWYEDGTIYWWSEDNTPSVNLNGFLMFNEMENLSNIEGFSSFDMTNARVIYGFFRLDNLNNTDSLSNWNVSNTNNFGALFEQNANLTSIEGISSWNMFKATSFSNLFYRCSSLEDFSAVKNWDTSNVLYMNSTFERTKIKNLEVLKNWNTSKVVGFQGLFDTDIIESTKGLENWDTSNVTTMGNLFARNYYLTDLSGLSNWNVSKVEDFGQSFLSCTVLEDLSPLENWNLSSAKDIYSMFNNNKKLTDLTPLRKWDVSNVTRMYRTFRDCGSLQELTGLENWDVSKVENFSQLFYKNDELTDISALTNWNTSSGTNMSSMFYNDKKITNVDAINDWEIQNVTTFSYMFRYLSTHPNFTKRQGTWSGGTFTPE